jgi:hypothetical protein
MLFQLRTDNHIDNSDDLINRVRGEVEGALGDRFASQLRRVEVYLQDVNSHKGGVDLRCSMEAHLAGLQPIAVHDTGVGIDEVVGGAADKLLRALERTVDRFGDRGGRVSMSGGET